jgi:hypothetical protein
MLTKIEIKADDKGLAKEEAPLSTSVPNSTSIGGFFHHRTERSVSFPQARKPFTLPPAEKVLPSGPMLSPRCKELRGIDVNEVDIRDTGRILSSKNSGTLSSMTKPQEPATQSESNLIEIENSSFCP